jgi:Winged helix-turn-helix DNA-binding
MSVSRAIVAHDAPSVAPTADIDLGVLAEIAESADDVLAASDADDVGWFAAVADRIAAAVEVGDSEKLRLVLVLLRNTDTALSGGDTAKAVRLAVRAVAEVTTALLDRLTVAAPTETGGSEWARVLSEILAEDGLSNTEIAERTGLDITQVSRAGRRLAAQGLAQSVRSGRANSWTTTARGAALANGFTKHASPGRAESGALAAPAEQSASPPKSRLRAPDDSASEAARRPRKASADQGRQQPKADKSVEPARRRKTAQAQASS